MFLRKLVTFLIGTISGGLFGYPGTEILEKPNFQISVP
jgi:hypothetical protein